MLRLTLRSGKDGRFLARIIDPGGFPFVLDFGDRRIIDDAQQRLLHGFTMWRFGRLVSAPPQDPDMILLLAEYYVSEGGLLVALEEPTWSGRDRTLDELVPVPQIDRELFDAVEPSPPPQPPPEDLPDLTEERQATELVELSDVVEREATELVDLDAMTDLGPLLEPATEDAEATSRPAKPAPKPSKGARPMWTPPSTPTKAGKRPTKPAADEGPGRVVASAEDDEIEDARTEIRER